MNTKRLTVAQIKKERQVNKCLNKEMNDTADKLQNAYDCNDIKAIERLELRYDLLQEKLNNIVEAALKSFNITGSDYLYLIFDSEDLEKDIKYLYE